MIAANGQQSVIVYLCVIFVFALDEIAAGLGMLSLSLFYSCLSESGPINDKPDPASDLVACNRVGWPTNSRTNNQ